MFTCNSRIIRVLVDRKLEKELVIKSEPIFNKTVEYSNMEIDKDLSNYIEQIRTSLGHSVNLNDQASMEHHERLKTLESKIGRMDWYEIGLYVLGGIVVLIVLAMITYLIAIIVKNIRKCRATRTIP